jgi:hypothetical protein
VIGTNEMHRCTYVDVPHDQGGGVVYVHQIVRYCMYYYITHRNVIHGGLGYFSSLFMRVLLNVACMVLGELNGRGLMGPKHVFLSTVPGHGRRVEPLRATGARR